MGLGTPRSGGDGAAQGHPNRSRGPRVQNSELRWVACADEMLLPPERKDVEPALDVYGAVEAVLPFHLVAPT